MNDIYYEVGIDHDTGREVMVVYDGGTAIDACFSFAELFKKHSTIQSKEFKEFVEGIKEVNEK